MSDDMFYARVCAERDQLRAELTAAKNRALIAEKQDERSRHLVCLWKEDREAQEKALSAMTAERDQLRAELTAAKNLLARIHRDGGHYTEAVGVTNSIADANEKWSEMLLENYNLTNELAAAKERGDGLYLGLRQTLEALGGVAQPGVSEAFLILGVPGEAAAIKRLNTALTAHVERLVEKGYKMRAAISGAWSADRMTSVADSLRPVIQDPECDREALAATPAQSLAAHDAAVKVAVLREVARLVDSHACEALMAEADRIEKEAANG